MPRNDSIDATRTNDERPPDILESGDRWKTWIPLGFIILSLLALLIVPYAVERRTAEFRQVVREVIEPARSHVTSIQVALAVGGSAVHDYRGNGETQRLERYRQAAAEEERAYAQLEPLVRRLDPQAVERYGELRRLTSRWHANVAALVDAPSATAGEVAAEQALYEQLLIGAGRLDEAITAESQRRREAIEAAERVNFMTTVVLVPLALIAALLVAWLGLRLRLLAGQLDRRVREEEALRRLARAFSGAVGVDEVMHRIADSSISITHADGAYVEQIDPAEQQVEIIAVAGIGSPPAGTRVPYPGSLTEKCIRDGEPALLSDVLAIERSMAPFLAQTCAGCSGLVVPLRSEGKALGALVILCRPGTFGLQPDEINRVRILSDLASLAIRRLLLLEEAQRRRHEVERLMESKARLIRGFTHDVKNPLGAAAGYSVLLEEEVLGALTARQKEGLKQIQRTIGTALQIIDDLLELSRAEAGQLDVKREPIDPASVVQETAEEHRAVAAAANLTLEIELPEKLPRITTDRTRMHQILSNLLSNAIKYTEEGCITVTAAVRTGGAAPGPGRWLVVDVSDTGPGIPREERESIFEEFSRLEPGTERGAGLGLAISRNLARLLGGDISVESKLAGGSTFSLWLPFAEPIGPVDREGRARLGAAFRASGIPAVIDPQ